MYWMVSAMVLNSLWADLSSKGNTASVLHCISRSTQLAGCMGTFHPPNMFSSWHGGTAM